MLAQVGEGQGQQGVTGHDGVPGGVGRQDGGPAATLGLQVDDVVVQGGHVHQEVAGDDGGQAAFDRAAVDARAQQGEGDALASGSAADTGGRPAVPAGPAVVVVHALPQR